MRKPSGDYQAMERGELGIGHEGARKHPTRNLRCLCFTRSGPRLADVCCTLIYTPVGNYFLSLQNYYQQFYPYFFHQQKLNNNQKTFKKYFIFVKHFQTKVTFVTFEFE